MRSTDNKTTTSSQAQKSTPTRGSFFQKGEEGQSFFQYGDTIQREAFFEPTEEADVQAKLKIGPVNDAFENEADQVADQVVQRMADPAADTTPATDISPQAEEEELQREEESTEELVQAKAIGTGEEDIRRKCSACEQEGGMIRRMPIEEETSPKVQAKCEACSMKDHAVQPMRISRRATSSDGGTSVPSGFSQKLNASKGGGSPLGTTTRSKMEGAFGGQDFSSVRIHTGSQATELSNSIQAKAFTHGNDIYFNRGQFDPNSRNGQHLIAHELTHTVQQGGGVRRKETGRDLGAAEARALNSYSVKKDVDTIEDRLQGFTSLWDSDDIVKVFQGKSPATHQAILTELKKRASQNNTTANGMVDWLLDDLTAEDRGVLSEMLVKSKVREAIRIQAKAILNLLHGYTSENDSAAILNLFKQLGNSQVDAVLTELESQAGQSTKDFRNWLLHGWDLTSVHVHKLVQFFYQAGTPKALNGYARQYTYEHIIYLLKGYTSIADSNSILNHFEWTPAKERKNIIKLLEPIASKRWQQTAPIMLMGQLTKGDYNAIRALPGLGYLPKHIDNRGWGEWIGDGVIWFFDWVWTVIQWIVCGVVGIVWGIIEAIIGIIGFIIDIVKAAIDIVGAIFYFITGGAIGSQSWLNVKNFFRGIGQLFSAPMDVVSLAWEEFMLEAKLIQGPFEACKEAFFWTSSIAKLVVDIVLIIKGVAMLVRKGISIGVKGFKALRQRFASPKAKVKPKPNSEPHPEFIDNGVRSKDQPFTPKAPKTNWHPNTTDELKFGEFKYSQSSVKPVLGDGKTTIDDLAKTMRKNGWDYSKEPPKMIDMGDGNVVSLDHRRLVAAQKAGIKKVPVQVIDGKTGITEALARTRNFTVSSKASLAIRTEIGKLIGYGGPVPKGYVAKNYREAIILRSARQGKGFSLTGSYDTPVIK